MQKRWKGGIDEGNKGATGYVHFLPLNAAGSLTQPVPQRSSLCGDAEQAFG